MARLNLGSVAAMVLAAIVVLLLGAGSYMVSSRMNRDAERRLPRRSMYMVSRGAPDHRTCSTSSFDPFQG
jgi:hypothetical protein